MANFTEWFFSAQGAVTFIIFIMLTLTIYTIFEIKNNRIK
jgi:hypothetical protein